MEKGKIIATHSVRIASGHKTFSTPASFVRPCPPLEQSLRGRRPVNTANAANLRDFDSLITNHSDLMMIFGTGIRFAARMLDSAQRNKDLYHRSHGIPSDGQPIYKDLLKGIGKYGQTRNPTIKEPDGSIGSGYYVGLGYPEDGNPKPDDSWSMAHMKTVKELDDNIGDGTTREWGEYVSSDKVKSAEHARTRSHLPNLPK